MSSSTLFSKLQNAGFFFLVHSSSNPHDFRRFLFTVAIDKEQREYMNWLKDIKKFVAK